MITEHEQRLAARDEQLPGLSTLLDAGEIGAIIGAHNADDREGLQLLYVRYKPGMNLLAGYGRDGVVECYAKTFRSIDVEKLTKAREKSGPDETGRVTRIVCEKPGIVISMFPDDAKLRTLRRVMTFREVRRIARMAGSSRRKSRLARLRYKPERRFVARLEDKKGAVACVKTYTREGLARATSGWRAATADDSVVTPRLLAEIPHLSTLVYEWVRGRSLNELFATSDCDDAHLKSAGQALARLHSLSPQERPRHAAAAMTHTLLEMRNTLSMLLPERKTQVDALFRDARRVVAELSARSCFLHGDFNHEQVIVNDEGVCLLDFDRTALGPPKIDLATFAAHLALDVCGGRMEGADAESAVEALTSGYVSAGGRLGSALSPLTAVVLLQLSSTPFRQGSKDWPDQVGRILDRCEHLFGAGSAPLRLADTEAHGGASDEKDLLEKQLMSRALRPEFVNDQLDGARDGMELDRRIVSARLLKRRSGKRFVVEYACTSARLDAGTETGTGSDTDAAHPGMIGKVRLKRIDERTFGIVRELHGMGFAKAEGRAFAVPEPLARLPELNMCLYDKVGNTSAGEAMLSTDGSAVAERIGRALASFHGTRPASDRHHSVPDELAILTDCLDRFGEGHPAHAGRVNDILQRCKRLVSDSPYTLSAIHRDFHPDNVIDNRGQVYFIDFDLYALGDPTIDAGNFVGHLIELAIRKRGDMRALDDVVDAFSRGYLDEGGPADHDRIQAFATLTIARHIYLSTTRSGRAATTEALMMACERRLHVSSAA